MTLVMYHPNDDIWLYRIAYNEQLFADALQSLLDEGYEVIGVL